MISLIFGADRSSRNVNVCMSLCVAQTFQEHSIFIILAQMVKGSSSSLQLVLRRSSNSLQVALKECSSSLHVFGVI